MFRIYKWGDDVPSYIGKVTGRTVPSFKFGGLVVVYKWKGKIILKLIYGKSIINIFDGVDAHVSFNDVVMKPATTPLSVFRRIRFSMRGYNG